MRGMLIISLLAATTALSSCTTQTYPLFSAETTTINTATYDQAYAYHNGQGIPRDYERAEKLYRSVAKAGDARAENNLGVMALRGQGRSVSYPTAARHFRKAAQMGSASAFYNLGLMHDAGMGLSKSAISALGYYTTAAEMGFADAQFRVGVMHENALGTPMNAAEARRYYEMAAIQGRNDAMMRISSLSKAANLDERSVLSLIAMDNCSECAGDTAASGMASRDYVNLMELAQQGDAPARYNLAIRLLNGDHANRNPSEAARLFTLAARQGYAPAQRQMAQLHLRGEGVVRSKVLAHVWMNLASKTTGNEQNLARQQMVDLEATMTPSEIAEAQDIAASWNRKGR
jgi:uncharacterized protein